MLIEPAIPKFSISFTRNSVKIVLFPQTCLTGDNEFKVFYSTGALVLTVWSSDQQDQYHPDLVRNTFVGPPPRMPDLKTSHLYCSKPFCCF